MRRRPNTIREVFRKGIDDTTAGGPIKRDGAARLGGTLWRRLQLDGRARQPWPLRGAAAGPLEWQPVVELYGEYIVASGGERIVQASGAHEAPRRSLLSPILLPHDIRGAARPPLPAQHHVAAEAQDVEVTHRESQPRRSIGDDQ